MIPCVILLTQLLGSDILYKLFKVEISVRSTTTLSFKLCLMLSLSAELTMTPLVAEELNFPIVWCTATFLSSLWQLKIEKKRVDVIKIRAAMEAKVRLFRESRLNKQQRLIPTCSAKLVTYK